MIQKYELFVLKNTVACQIHQKANNWSEIRQTPLKYTYTASQVEDIIDLLRADVHTPKVENERYKKTQTGLNSHEFKELSDKLPSLHAHYKNNSSLANAALQTYLMKLRTGCSDEVIGSILGLSRTTVTVRLNAARRALMNDFVAINRSYERNELLSHNTALATELFCGGDKEKMAIIFDGTYIYINKSGNFNFQKFTYNDHKKRNYVKPMMGVAPDGAILFLYGLYPATSNDAKIMQEILDKHSNIFSQFLPNDVFILDRGFRDCEAILKEKAFEVQMPAFIKTGNSQLSTKQANYSRLVTKCRYIVEMRNGHLKKIFKIFDTVWCSYGLIHLKDDLMIAASIINCFKSLMPTYSTIDKEYETARKMIQLKDTPNNVWNVVKTKQFNKEMKLFRLCENMTFFPLMSMTDLEEIALGKYQIRMSQSYCTEHLRGESAFECFEMPGENVKKFFAHLLSDNSKPHLLLGKIKSRFRSQKRHNTFLLIDETKIGHAAVLGYCCACKNGLRTVGCCSHVMVLIWYLGYALKNDKVRPISEFLDKLFDSDNEIIDDEMDDDNEN